MIYRLEDRRVRFADDHHWVAPNAILIGDVSIGHDVSVWWGAVLRGDVEPIAIGDGSNVQEHCVLHTDPGFPLTVGRNVTVGHMACLHGCTIGDGALIGIGAMVLNGARVGRNCLVAAGAVVGERAEIPDDSLVVGIPAQVKRQLTPEHVERMARNTESYQQRWKRYRDGLKPQEG